MVRNPASTERARRISEDALFTSLSAGCHPEQRLQVAQNLFGNIDIGYNSLVTRHVEATRDEVLDIDRHELVEQGKKLLARIVE
jgi:hypothetical protein